jgi:hypothetical protein
MAGVMFPTNAAGDGLAWSAPKLTLLGLFSYHPRPGWEASANLGYVVDRTEQIFDRDITRSERFAANVADTDHVILGMGVSADVAVAGPIDVCPFAEVHADIGTRPKGSEPAVLLATGAKAFLDESGMFELAVGGEFRVSGRPVDGALPGVPPWALFGRIGVSLFNRAQRALDAKKRAAHARTCGYDVDCGAGHACVDGLCLPIKEVIRTEEKRVEVEVERAVPTFFVTGTVRDAATGKVLTEATVTVRGFEASPLALDSAGTYRTYAIPTGAGLIQIEFKAPGYIKMERTLARGGAGSVAQLNVELQRAGPGARGLVRGSVRDARTGAPLQAKVFLPALGRQLKVGSDGSFSDEIPAGRYEVLISRPGYAAQKMGITIEVGEAVILNVDMTAR